MKLNNLFVFLTLCVPFFWSCNDNDEISIQAKSLNIELNTRQCSIRDMGNDFANNLLIHAAEENENTLLSPLSLQFVLGIIANGADKETYAELTDALGLSDYSLEDLNEYHRTMIDGLTTHVENVDFSLGNAVWIQNGIPVEDSFLANMNDYYSGSVNYLDFSQSEDAKQKINDWAYQATHSTIEDLQLPLNASTQLVLNNACYFRGEWSSPFDKAKTQQREFTCESGDVVNVPFMQSKESTSYVKNDGYEQIFMAFNGGFSLSIVLPEKDCKLEDILPDVNWVTPKNVKNYTVDLKLPKFEIEWMKNLNTVLQEMGINKIYSPGALPYLASDMAISLIQQNTSFSIDESGVKAAATTSGTVEPSANVSPVVSFDLNRPFAFAIRENSSKTLLFIGKIANLQ